MNSFIFKFFLFEDFCLEDFTRSREDKTIWSERPRYTNPARGHTTCPPRMPGGSGNSWFQFSVSMEPDNTSPITQGGKTFGIRFSNIGLRFANSHPRARGGACIPCQGTQRLGGNEDIQPRSFALHTTPPRQAYPISVKIGASHRICIENYT